MKTKRAHAKLPTAQQGFTLLEILVALAIFTIIAILMTQALHHILNLQARTDKRAARLTELQTSLLFISRDLEQAIDRPIKNGDNVKELAFVGTKNSILFTHGGFFNPLGKLQRSTLQRTQYLLAQTHLIRLSWPVLDTVKTTLPNQRELLSLVNDINFEYIDAKGNRFNSWPPINASQAAALPHAVRLHITLSDWGKITQTYLITGQNLGKPN